MSDSTVIIKPAVKAARPGDGGLFPYAGGTPGVFDELALAGGRVRPHWQQFATAMEALGPAELAARWDNGQRILHEHGVTYNVYGDAQGQSRPWGLDLAPLLVSAADWARVEAGLRQRSRLLNRILADLYGGSQRLLRDGFLPPDLVYGNPGFLRTCRGMRPPKDVYVFLLGCDLARASDGGWWALADRTQAPSGAGYALENRTVISRILPEEFRDAQVRRLSDFFRRERELLTGLAPAGQSNPHVVLLTPGPLNETYFEHAYLARHLGFTLVEGADLTVRDRRVFLKTLDGLQPVDIILRRVDDGYCDPLELRGESFLGVPGLVEATRAGTVTIANALGSSLLESPAFLAFLPRICRHLLDEELLIPSAATWWCGQAAELRYVLEHLKDLVIKPTFGGANQQPKFGARLSAAELAELREQIRARPHLFVGQERVVLSRAPVWAGDHFEARAVVLRGYVANGGDAMAVLPGGLTRVGRTDEDPVVSMQSGGGSKDTWVLLSEQPQAAEATLATGHEPRPVPRGGTGVPSRTADSLFWLGRYAERLEQTLRLLRCALGRLSDESAREGSPELLALGGLLQGLQVLLPGEAGRNLHGREAQHRVLNLIYKPELTGSVRELLSRLRFLASAVRDRLSGDTWRILGRLEADARSRPGRLPLANASTLIHTLVFDLVAFSGVSQENMTRGHGWRLLDAGRRIERALSLLRLLAAALRVEGVEVRPARVLEPVLEIADSVLTYRRRFFAEAQVSETLELLLRDESNPRSLAFQLSALREHCLALPHPPAPAPPPVEWAHLEAMTDALSGPRWAALALVVDSDARTRPERLGVWLAESIRHLEAFSDGLTHRYFSHILPRVS